MWPALAICLLTSPVQEPQPEPVAAPSAPPQELVPVPEPDVWTTEGARIPLLELPLIDGTGTFDLGSLQGKRALLIQFASW